MTDDLNRQTKYSASTNKGVKLKTKQKRGERERERENVAGIENLMILEKASKYTYDRR